MYTFLATLLPLDFIARGGRSTPPPQATPPPSPFSLLLVQLRKTQN